MMKKLVALLMALALLCTSIGAFADEGTLETPESNTVPVVSEDIATLSAPDVSTEPDEPDDPTADPTPECTHVFENKWEVTTPAGVLTDGEETLVCSECGAHSETTRTVPAIFDTSKAAAKDFDLDHETDIPATDDNKKSDGTKIHKRGFEAKSNAQIQVEVCQEKVLTFYCIECRAVINVTVAAKEQHTASKEDIAGGKTKMEPIAAGCETAAYIRYTGRCSVCKQENLQWDVKVSDPAGHDYVLKETTPADCKQPKKETWVCNNANCPKPTVTKEIGTKLEHDWVEGSYVNVATCTTPGSYGTGKVCARCGEADKANQTTNVVIDTLNHQKVLNEIIKDADGNEKDNEFWVKNGTKYELAGELAAKLAAGKNVQDEAEAKKETATVAGETKVVAKYGQLKFDYTAPTCTEKGHITVTCIACGATVGHDIDALGHSFDKDFNPWNEYDCTKSYSRLMHCEREGCDFSYNLTIPAFAKHTFDNVVGYAQKLPTGALEKYYAWEYEDEYTGFEEALTIAFDRIAECQDYYKIVRCSNGGDRIVGIDEFGNPIFDGGMTCEIEELVPVAGNGKHVPDDGEPQSREEATCLGDGHFAYVCAECGIGQVETITAKGHDMVDGKVVKAAKCDEEGSRVIYCSRCRVLDANGNVVQSVAEEKGLQYAPIPEIDHIYAVYYDPANCRENKQGLRYEYCTMCGVKRNEEVLDGHYPKEGTYQELVPVTCTTPGYVSYTCAYCNTNFPLVEVKPTGHSYEYDEDGVRLTLDEVKKAHEKGNAHVGCTAPTCVDNKKHVLTCTNPNCPDKTLTWYEEGTATGKHIYKEGNAVVESFTIIRFPTCEQAGYALYTCKDCNKQQRYDLPQLPHNLKVDYDADDEVFYFYCEELYKNWYHDWYDDNEEYAKLIRQAIKDPVVATEVYERAYAATPNGALYGTFGGSDHVVEVPAMKTEFAVSKVNSSLGKITLKDENMSLFSQPYVRITWCYTLGNGDTVSFTACREAKLVDVGEYTFKLTGLRVPSDAKLDDIWAEVVVDPDADELFVGQYKTYGEDSVK